MAFAIASSFSTSLCSKGTPRTQPIELIQFSRTIAEAAWFYASGILPRESQQLFASPKSVSYDQFEISRRLRPLWIFLAQ